MNINIDIEKLNDIISSLDGKIKSIKETSSEMTSHINEVLNNNWDSIVKEKTLVYYSNVSNEIKDNINKLESLKIFLENTKENYLNSDNSLNDDIEKNIDELSI